MKIVVLNGSPRKGGNTEIMINAFTEAAQKHEVVRLDIAHMNIRGCLACKYCYSHQGECVQKDDMGKVLEELKDADIDMFSVVIVGNSQTYTKNGRMITPRGYRV